MSNAEITTEIRARLEDDPRIPHPKEIAIAERDGAVTLRGSVGGIPQRREAVRIARSVDGVNYVDDQLVIDLHDSFYDDEMRGAALQALISDPDVPDERVDVRVTDAWLYLRGEVEHQEESNAAFEAVSDIEGIGGITNEIRVVTAGIDG